MLDTLQRLQAFQRLARVWAPHLSPAEITFVLWLLDVTVSYGRLTFKASVAQMVAGSENVPALCLSVRTTWRVLASIREKGLATITENGVATSMTVNLEWEPPLMALKLPKRLQQPAPERDEFGDVDPSEQAPVVPKGHRDSAKVAERFGQNGTPYKGKGYRTPKPVEQPSSLRSDAGVRESVQPVAKPNSAIEAIRAVSSRQRDPSKASSAWSAWRDAWVLAFPEAGAPTAWDKVALAQVKKLSENLTTAGIAPTDFLSYTVGNWRGIIAAKFAWMRDNPPPQFPAVGFVLRFRVQFLDAYMTQQQDAAIAVMPGDKAAYVKLVNSGMTHDEALVELGRQKGKGEARTELADEKAKVGRMSQTLNRRAAEMEALQRVANKKSVLPQQSRPTIQHGQNLYESGGALIDIIELPPIDFDGPNA